jgi:hydrogenase maturation protease
MSASPVERLAAALLYEGYLLYPYRPSSVKNRYRFNFGVVVPEAWARAHQQGEAQVMQTECLVEGTAESSLTVCVRFLQLRTRTIGRPSAPGSIADATPVERLEVDGRVHVPWQEAVEREIRPDRGSLGELAASPHLMPFGWIAETRTESLVDSSGVVAGVVGRRLDPLTGNVELSAVPVSRDGTLYRVRVRISNQSPMPHPERCTRDGVLGQSLVSTHTMLMVDGGAFLSATDPPAAWAREAAACQNIGTWPVLVGEAGQTNIVLSSPIVLSDYPSIAPESPGDLFDATEIDEILSLRILTLTDDERREAESVDERSQLLLERTHALAGEQLRSLHGVMREPEGS